MSLSFARLNNADRAAWRVIRQESKRKEIEKGQKRFGMIKRLEAAKRSGNEIEVAARMICRIMNGGKAQCRRSKQKTQGRRQYPPDA